MTEEKTTQEEFKVSGKDVVERIKNIIKEGNARRIIIKNEKDIVIMEIPLTLAVVGAVLVPILAAVGAVAALVTECTIAVVRNK